MIDIINCQKVASDFEGSERKFAILYHNEVYMIKEPDPIREKNNELSYMNNTFSEHIGCQIFKLLHIPVQDTFLATYTRPDGKNEIVVACKDFRKSGEQLYEADKFAKSLIDSRNMTKPDYTDIQKIFNEVKVQMTEDAEQRFWEIFVIDGLIGNKDRHLENCGFFSSDRIHLTLAPVCDCGSSLGALVDEAVLQKCLDKPGLMSNMECNISTRFLVHGRRVTYREVFNCPTEKLASAMKWIIPQIDMKQIEKLVENIPGLSPLRKMYMLVSMKMRYEQILCRAMKKL